MGKALRFQWPACPITIAFLLSPCASVGKPSGFLSDYSVMEEGPCFKQQYADPKTDFSRYAKVQVQSVNLQRFDKQARLNLGKGEPERLASVLERELRSQLGGRYRVLASGEVPDKETLIVRPALVYVRTPYRLINVVTTLLILLPVTVGVAAFEVELADGATGNKVAQAAEKRTGARDFKSLVIGPFMKYQNAEAIFKIWSKQLRVFLETK